MRHPHRFAAVSVIACLLLIACGGPREVIEPTAHSSVPAASVIKTLQVAPARVECTGVAAQMCLQVRQTSDAAWTNLYDPIAGFDYEPGYLYEIRVQEETVTNPPADASSLRRTLVSLISKTPASAALLGPTWRLTSIEGREALKGVRVTAVFGDDNRVSGSGGCNRYSGSAAMAGQQMRVGLLATTRMYCGAAGVMPQEQAYLAALEKATVYRIVGADLHLGPAPGAVTLVFKLE